MFRRFSAWFFTFVLIVSGGISCAATLRWFAPNSLIEKIEFYTVYIDSPQESLVRQVREPSFSLDELLPGIAYTLSVSATSMEGVESERSPGVPYVRGFPLPTIVSHPHPANVTRASGNPLILSVAASTPLGVKYEWYKDNRPVENQFLPVLTILDPTPADSGNYSVLVSTPGGHVESQSVRVIVQDPPYIISQPISAFRAVGTQFEFSVDASGTDLRYQWYKAGQPLPGATNSSLMFPQLNFDDKSSYRVSIRNMLGQVASEVALLDVSYIPVAFTGPHSTNLVVGETIVLRVDITDGSSPFTFQWMKNGLPLDWATNATFALSSVRTNDSGSYRVSVANPISFVTSPSANVTISPPPPFLTMSMSDTGFLWITGVAAPGTTHELQRTDSLINSNWVGMQDVVVSSNGSFEVSIPPSSHSEFIRTVQK